MSSDHTLLSDQAPSGDEQGIIAEPRLILFMEPGRDRELLGESLDEDYEITATTEVERLDLDFDCCILDAGEFNRVAGTIQSKRDTDRPDFLPFLLLVSEGSAGGSTTEAWEYVDDIIEMPIKKAALRARIRNLVERRRASVRLADREAKLQETVADLQLKERAMDAAPVGITISDPDRADNPMIYVNEMFQKMTGYTSDAIGTNCRFLQGEETDSDTRARIRAAVDEEEPVSVDILNYRKNGQKFWNKLDIAPIRDEHGEVTHFVGFQADITDRKIKERRVQVLNRVLSHNLRNKMNIIEGRATLLRDEIEDEWALQSISKIEQAAENLSGLADHVRELDRILKRDEPAQVIDLQERLGELLSGYEDRYPRASISLKLGEDDAYPVAIPGLLSALEEAIENAIKHNDAPEPQVKIRVERGSEDWIEIRIEDNGPGIPDESLEVLSSGESRLEHADRLGLWLVYLTIERAGGYFSVSKRDPHGTLLELSLPTSSDAGNG